MIVKNRDRGATPGCLKRFEPLYDMPLADIKRAHVIRILDSIMAEGKPYRANRALASIKKLFAWSRDRGYIEHHPIDRLKPPGREIARDRILTAHELSAGTYCQDRQVRWDQITEANLKAYRSSICTLKPLTFVSSSFSGACQAI